MIIFVWVTKQIFLDTFSIWPYLISISAFLLYIYILKDICLSKGKQHLFPFLMVTTFKKKKKKEGRDIQKMSSLSRKTFFLLNFFFTCSRTILDCLEKCSQFAYSQLARKWCLVKNPGNKFSALWLYISSICQEAKWCKFS